MMESMNSAVSGLGAQQTEMDVIGNNIANVNTIGFQASSTVFEEAMAQTLEGSDAPNGQTGGTNPQQVGLGVTVGTIAVSQTQGALQTTGTNTDLAIDGSGFFVLGQGSQQYYTRNGSFGLDSQSNLVDPSNGMHVLGWQANSSGAVNSNAPVTPIQIPLGDTIIAKASASAVMQGNLDAGTAVAGTVTAAVNLYDSLGNPNSVTFTFTNTASDAWSWTAAGTGITVGAANQGTLTFNSTGALTGSTGALQIVNATGAATPQAVAVDFSKMTQFASANTASPMSQDGYASGTLTTFTIGQDGTISGTYSNGVNQSIGQVALGTFSNPGGLIMTADSLYQSSSNSGSVDIGTPEAAGRGSIQSGSLEMSNVNLADEFTTMVTTERAYQANSKVITVCDELLQDLINMQRS